MSVGILMEKPSAARNGAKAWGGPNGTFEGEAYVIANARGHLYEFVDPFKMVEASLQEQYYKWNLANLPWDPSQMNFDLEPVVNTSDVRRELKKKLGSCDEIAIATDDDPTGEGDAIAIRAILELGLGKGKKFTRLHFTDESEASLKKAFRDRVDVPSLTEHPAFKMADFRAKWDLLSMQFTRVATNMARESGQDIVVRQGRLKSAMVGLVGDQLKAYNDYVKKPFFQNRFRDENEVVYSNPEEPRFDKAGQVPAQYDPSPVVCDSKTEKKTTPPKLLDLAALSSMLVGKGVKAQLSLSTYQKMYEAGVVSYPRTEDKTITPEQFDELAPLADRIAGVVGVDTKHLTHRQPRSTHVKPKGAHGANRPGPNVPRSLEQVEADYGTAGRHIYEILAKNYLAILAEDYRYEQQKGHVEKYPDFTGIANVPLLAGWKAVFDPDADDESAGGDEDESSKGLGTNAAPFVYEGANKRPEHPSMKWLMKQLEKRDVGTGATRTSTYSEVTSSRAKNPLLVEKGRKVTLARAGEVSWLLLPDTRIGDLGVTEGVYTSMRAVCEGSADADALLAEIADWVRADMTTMAKNAESMRSELGLSKEEVVEKERAEGTWAVTGKAVAFNRRWGGHRFTDEEVSALLAGETIDFSGVAKSGNSFDVYGKLAEGEIKGRKYVGFIKEGFGRRGTDGTPLPPEAWCKHTFTQTEQDTLASGGAVEATDFVSKAGRAFSTSVTWDKTENKIVPDFDSGDHGGSSGSSIAPPSTWCRHTFTST
ncbi:MAG: DNA topoisomerase [Nocardioidaceae bacterium]|nr:DNA topoisomerase [Nocardioidaceae bacterium]